MIQKNVHNNVYYKNKYSGRRMLMVIINATKFRTNFKEYCDKAVHEKETIFITRANGENVVTISQEEYEKLLQNAGLDKKSAKE